MDALWQDVRYAIRSLRRAPRLTVVVLTTLSLGIAVVTTFFSLLNSIVWRPLPYKDADRIVMIFKNYKAPDEIVGQLLESSRSIERVAFHAEYSGVMTGAGEPLSLTPVHVDSGFFPLLRLTPILGVLPNGRETINGPPVVVISERIWRSAFNADSSVIGRSVTIGGESYRITAVLSRDFSLPNPRDDAWLPMARPYEEGDHVNDFVARLAPGATIADLQRDIDLTTARIHAADPGTTKFKRLFSVVPEMLNRYFTLGYFVQPLRLVVAGAGVVLLIACTNLALLMIVRGARRRGEMVVRASLGAARWQLVRQQAVESVLLAGSAAVLGTLLSVWGAKLVIAGQVPESYREYALPGWFRIGIDWHVAAFAFAIALATVAVVGIWPARAATRVDLGEILRADGSHAIAGGDPTRAAHLPIVLQLTLSLGLFAGAIMLGMTYRAVSHIDRGYNPHDLYGVSVTTNQDTSSLRTTEFFRRVRDELASVAGMQASLDTRFESYNGEQTDRAAYTPGSASSVVPGSEWRPDPAVVSDAYFRAMGTPLLAGREFNAGDVTGAPPVAIVSRAFALRAWGTDAVIGKTLQIGKPEEAKRKGKTKVSAPGAPALATVVGVVGDFRAARIGEASLIWSRPDVYLSDRQARFTYARLVVRSSQGMTAVRKAVAAAIQRAGRELPVRVIARESAAAQDAESAKSLSMMMGTFAAVSLLLALMGLYGIVAFTVEQRTREVGIRLALGAQAADVVRLIMASGARLAAIGLALGFGASMMLGKVMASFVVGSTTSQLAIAVISTLVFAVVALLASLLPARRAARLDPVDALRSG